VANELASASVPYESAREPPAPTDGGRLTCSCGRTSGRLARPAGFPWPGSCWRAGWSSTWTPR
jgi:hypothetical protein